MDTLLQCETGMVMMTDGSTSHAKHGEYTAVLKQTTPSFDEPAG